MSNNTETFIINLNDRGVTSGLRQAANETERTHGRVNALNGAFKFFATAAAGFSLVQVGSEIISTLSEFEKFEAVLTNTLGSKSAAQKALNEISDFAARTPYQVDALTGAYVKLANRGFKPTVAEMTKLGDLASSTGKGFDQLAEAMLDAETFEFERLKEFGVTAKQTNKDVTFSFKGVQTTVGKNSEEMRKYMLSLGDVVGVSGAMAAISKTTGGQISNLKDKVTQLYLNIGQKLKPAITGAIQFFSDTIAVLGDFVNWLNSGSTGAEIFISVLYGVVGALAIYKSYLLAVSSWTAIVTAAQYLYNAALTANPIGLVIVAVAALIGSIIYLSRTFTGWGEAWNHTLKGASLTFAAFISGIKTLWLGQVNGFMMGINTIKKGWYEFKNLVGLGDSSENNSIIDEINKDTERRKKEIIDGVSETAKLTGEALNEFKLAGSSIKRKTNEDEKTAKDDFINSKGKGGAGSTTGGTGGGSTKGIGAGISEVKSSAPKIFNINIDSLVKELNISTTNLTESMPKIKEAITRTLLTAVNDSQIIAE
jgi:hypothetical protein